VTWTAPTLETDGTALTDLAGFHILYGVKQGGPYTVDIAIVGTGITTYAVDGLLAGNYCFVMTAYDATGDVSIYSPEVCVTFP
jgi:hypothetical protein